MTFNRLLLYRRRRRIYVRIFLFAAEPTDSKYCIEEMLNVSLLLCSSVNRDICIPCPLTCMTARWRINKAYSCTAHANNHFGRRYTCVNLLSLLLIPVPHSTCCWFFLIGLEAWFCPVDYFTLLYKLLAFSLSSYTPCLYLSHVFIHLLKS